MKRLVFLLFGFTACATSPSPKTPPTPAEYPGLFREPTAAGPDFMWRQRVTATYGTDDARHIDAVLQKQGNTLRLVGLTPIDTVAFVVEQNGMDITFDNRTSVSVPFNPRYILLDVQRVFFPWLEGDTNPRQGERNDETVTERLDRGQVIERIFERSDGPYAEALRVTRSLAPPGCPPARATLNNPWFGYRLTIETLDAGEACRYGM